MGRRHARAGHGPSRRGDHGIDGGLAAGESQETRRRRRGARAVFPRRGGRDSRPDHYITRGPAPPIRWAPPRHPRSALGRIAPGTASADEAIAALTEALDASSPDMRFWAVESLHRFGPRSEPARSRLRKMANDPDPQTARPSPPPWARSSPPPRKRGRRRRSGLTRRQASDLSSRQVNRSIRVALRARERAGEPQVECVIGPMIAVIRVMSMSRVETSALTLTDESNRAIPPRRRNHEFGP